MSEAGCELVAVGAAAGGVEALSTLVRNPSLANLQAPMLFNFAQREVGGPFSDLEISYRPVELRSQIDLVYAERHQGRVRFAPLVDGHSARGAVVFMEATEP